MNTLTKIIIASVCLISIAAADPTHLPNLGQPQRLYLSHQQEHVLAEEMLDALEHSGLLLHDPLSSDYLNQIGQKLVKNSPQPQSTFHFLLIDLPGINAFAGPDGYIVVHTGLFKAAESEDELASVLAHEIAHVTQGHLAQRIEDAKRMRLPALAGVVAASALTIVSAGAASGTLMATLAGTEQHQLNYSRRHETEADNIGLSILADAGYDPNAMAAFFHRLMKEQNQYEAMPELLSSHPLTENRLAEIESRAAQLTHPMQAKKSDHFSFIKERLTVMTSDDLHRLELTYRKKALNHPKDLPIQYGLALTLLGNGAYQDAYALLLPLKNDKLFLQLAFANAAFESQHHQDALEVAKSLHARFPNEYAVTVDYAYFLLYDHQAKNAVVLLQDYHLHHPTGDMPYELLARAQAESGDKASAYQTRAQLFLQHNQPQNALSQLESALRHSADNPALQKILQAKIAALKEQSRQM